MIQNQQSPLDREPLTGVVTDLCRAGETNTFIARYVENHHGIETSPDSIRRFRKRHDIQIPGTERSATQVRGDEATLTTPVSTGYPILDDPDAMLKQRGLNPEEWFIDSITVNEWEGPESGGNKVTYYQAKFTAKRKKALTLLQPVRSDGWTPVRGTESRDAGDVELVVICGDQQAPFHDKELHRLFVSWLAEEKPDHGVLLGDLIDLPDISRHPKDPENTATAQECLQAGYDIARGYVTASPSTFWEYLPGNHDERIRQYMLNQAPGAYNIRQVDSPDEDGEPVHGLHHLMRLDELGIQFIEPNGGFEDAQVELSKNLAVRHGWLVRQGAGATALKTLEQTGYSIIVGHTHRQSIVHHTKHDIDRQPTTLMAAETGCMCRIDSGRDEQGRRFPSYAVLPDWQQGFATATVWPDGKFRLDLGTYVNGTLLWRDKRYE